MLIERWELRAKVLPNMVGVPSLCFPEVKLLSSFIKKKKSQRVSAAPLHQRSFSWFSVYFIPQCCFWSWVLLVAASSLVSPEKRVDGALRVSVPLQSVPAWDGECGQRDPAAGVGC